ncbi:MAG: hypothetical protein U0V74_16580 [Chitinophagales bacterium]
MKRFLILFAGALAFANIAGIMPFYTLGLMEVKNEMRKELADPATLQKLEITESELNDHSVFQWVEGSEFSYQGKMYDMARQEKRDGYFVFYVVQDEKEDNLLSMLKVFYQDHQESKDHSPLSNLVKNIAKDFVSVFDTIKIDPLNVLSAHSLTEIVGNLSEGFSTALIVPPAV